MKAAQSRRSTSFRRSALLMLAVSAASAAHAQEPGWYAGLNLGKSGTEFRTTQLGSALQAAGRTVTSISTDDEDSGWKLSGGYAFNDWLAAEASYVDLGDFGAHASLLPTAHQFGSAELSGLGIDLVASLPINERLFAFGRLGLAQMRVEQRFSNPAMGAYFASDTERDVQEKYGLGAEYRITDAFSVRTEYERFHLEGNQLTDDHADMVSRGLVYRFGRRTSAPPPAAPVRTEAPAPQPAAPVSITLAASALFDFDRSDLKPAGQAELDRLLRDLRGLTYEVILVTGHTDRIGTRAYNLALSERRANTVRAYLVNAGVPDSVITARGVNSDEPVTTPEQCQGPVSDELKACLQPDRRVVVEVTGERE